MCCNFLFLNDIYCVFELWKLFLILYTNECFHDISNLHWSIGNLRLKDNGIKSRSSYLATQKKKQEESG